MGCGVSRPGATNEDSEATTGLRGRIVDLKRKISTSTPSRKQLLPDDRTEVDEHSPPHSPRDDSRKSVSSPENKGELNKIEKEEAKTMESDKTATIAVNEEKRTEVEKREGEEKEYTEEEDNGEHDDDEFSDIDGQELAPGSPSFRMYYVDSLDNSMDTTDSSKVEDGNDDEKTEKKKRRNQSIASSEGSVTGLVKKEQRGRRFRRGLPKVFNVTSCYSPCATPHENSHMVNNVKVTAA